MSYAALHSPLPGLTVSPDGCHSCGMRGFLGNFLGQDENIVDVTPVDVTPVDTTPVDISVPYTPTDTGTPSFTLDSGASSTPNIITPDISSGSPSTIGTEFVSVGGGNYLNTQTGQTVPQSIAEQVTAATTGSATANLQTVETTPTNLTLTDPTTGQSSTISTDNLTAAAKVLQAAGQLVDSAGKLTSQGQTLLNSGNLYNAVPQTGASATVSAALASVSSWFTQSSLISGVPNYMVAGGALVGLAVLSAVVSGMGKPRRRRR